MREPTFATLEAAGHYALANVNAGFAASFRLRRVVPSTTASQPGLPGVRLVVIRYAAVLLDQQGRQIEEYAA